MLKTDKKGTKPHDNAGSTRIVTLSGVTVLGFCHWYSCHSNLPLDWAQGGEPAEPFRASCFGVLVARIFC